MGRLQGGQNTEWTEYRVARIQGVQSAGWVEYRVDRVQIGQNTEWTEYRVGRIQDGQISGWADFRVGRVLSGQSTVWAGYRVDRIPSLFIINQLVDVRCAVTILSNNIQHQFSLILAEDTIPSHKRSDLRKWDFVGQ